MSQQHSLTPQQQPSTSTVRPALNLPLPIELSLLRQVGGGLSNGSPHTNW